MKRSSIEIRADVLSQIKNGVEPLTRLVHAVNCNWRQLGPYLDELVEQGLVEYSVSVEGEHRRKREHYGITPKGEEFLNCLSEVRRLVSLENVV